MRLAEEEKLRKEMSAKKAKEEAERKHQVSQGHGHLQGPPAGSSAFSIAGLLSHPCSPPPFPGPLSTHLLNCFSELGLS